MNSLKGINEILKAHKEDLYKKYKVTEIGVFGSIIRGEQRHFAMMPGYQF